jgi:polyphosphate kinase
MSVDAELAAAQPEGHAAVPRSVLRDLPPLPPHRFNDRELSWLQFNERVLELSENPDLPLLDRAKFLAIFASNLDEFFMVRVAGLKRRIATGIAVSSASGRPVTEILVAIHERVRDLMQRQSRLFSDEVLPGLQAEGITLLSWDDVTDEERARLHTLFRERVFPVLTPLAVDPSHPFPYISGLSLNLAVVVRNPNTGNELFARVKVPPVLDRLIQVSPARFIPLEDVIAVHLDQLFPGMEILQHHTFRITRNEDLEVEEDDAENLLKALERELIRRRFGPPVRLEVQSTIDPYMLDLLVTELGMDAPEVIEVPGLIDLTALWQMYGLDRPDLKQAPFVPQTAHELASVETALAPDVLDAMRNRDVFLHHPYDSFNTSVQRFLEQAAADPQVLAIKQTLYRTSGDSPIIDALIDAAEAGKQVLALVEIKARFDEQANIKWGRKLERAGVHVVYGLVGLKTHCKLSMVVRDDGDMLRRYVHIGTGNYHPKTARLYEDFGLLTTDPDVGEDVSRLFNVLSGYSNNVEYARLLVAPHSIRSGLIERIEREVEHHLAGRPAGIRVKCNSIVDEKIIDALYRASQAGVPVDVWVRGICAMRADVPGTESLRVLSILGRFLEHSRAYGFINGGSPQYWIGSADLMHRNLDRRVEVLLGISEPRHVALIDDMFERGFSDRTAGWRLQPDGSWHLVSRAPDGTPRQDYQETLIVDRRRRKGSRIG